MWCCEVCNTDIKIITKSSPIKSTAHIGKQVTPRLNNNLTERKYTYLNPEVNRVDDLFTTVIDDCTKSFHRFKFECVFVVKFVHETDGTTVFFGFSK